MNAKIYQISLDVLTLDYTVFMSFKTGEHTEVKVSENIASSFIDNLEIVQVTKIEDKVYWELK